MTTAAHIRLVLWKAAKTIEKVDRASIAHTGLQLSEFTIMEALMHKGPLTITAIGEKALLTSGSMTAAINRLEHKGYVRRQRDASDGRRCHVHLTDTGRPVIDKAYAKHAANLERVTEALTPSERETLVRLLKAIGHRAASMDIG